MAKQTKPAARSNASRRSGGGSVGKVLLGMLIGSGLVIVGVVLYFYFGSPAVAVTDGAPLWEPLIQSIPLKSRATAESKTPPFSESEDVFEAAAKTYRAHCVQCHGSPAHDAPMGRIMSPHAPQFFTHDKKATSAQDAGELYWKTTYGIRRSGMPAYSRTLTDTQLWQIALLLHSAGDELPDPVRALLTQGDPAPQPTVVKP
jgi:mono/diheme cytochrome c family protein